MAKPKGAPKTGGRTPGTPNKKTAETQRAVEESGLTPLEFMLQVMRDPGAEMRERMTMAAAAAPFVHARLSSIEMNANVTNHEAALDELK